MATTRLVAQLVDRVSGPARRAAAGVTALNSAVAAPGRAAQAMGRSLNRAGRHMSRFGRQAQSTGSLAGAMITGVMLKRQYDYEKSLNKTQSILRILNRDAFTPLRDKVAEIAAAYPAMRDEIAQGTSEMAMAGMGMKTIIATLEETVRGSMASGESIATVAGGVTDVIMGMALPFKNATQQAESFKKVNDALAAGASTYNQTYTALLRGLGRAGPVSRSVGMSLTDTAAILGSLADAGFKGSKGGKALSTSMVRVAAPTKAARTQLRAAGIELDQFMSRTAKFQGKGQGGVLGEMIQENIGLFADESVINSIDRILENEDITKNASVLGDRLTQALTTGLDVNDAEGAAKVRETVSQFVRAGFSNLDFMGFMREVAGKGLDANTAFMDAVFGKRHISKMSALTSTLSSGAFDEKRIKLIERMPGAVKQMADIQMQGFVGSVQRLASAFDALSETLLVDTGIIKRISEFAGSLKSLANSAQEANPTLLKLAGWALIAMPAIAAFGFAVMGIGSAVTMLGSLAAAAGSLVLAAGPLAPVLAGIAAAGTALYQNWSGLGEFFSSFGSAFSEALAPMQQAQPVVEAIKSAVSGIASALTVQNKTWREWGQTLGSVAASGVNTLVSALQKLISALTWVYDKAKAVVGAISSIFSAGSNVKSAAPSGVMRGPTDSAPTVDGKRAAGGPVWPGGRFLVGERGPEIFTPNTGGRVDPPRGSGGAPVTINNTQHITVNGNADAATVKQSVRRAMEEFVSETFRGVQADAGLKFSS